MLDISMLKVKATMFAHGSSVVVDSIVWHKIIGYINMPRLKLIQSKEFARGLPKLKIYGMQILMKHANG